MFKKIKLLLKITLFFYKTINLLIYSNTFTNPFDTEIKTSECMI